MRLKNNGNKIDELEERKAELERAFEEKKRNAQVLMHDIELMERLLMAKDEHRKVMGEMERIAQEHGKICEEIEAEKAKAEKEKDKPEKAVKKEKA